MNKKNLKKETNFYILIDNLFLKIEDILNKNENKFDIDYEIQDYVITISFPSKNLVIINKQESLKQVWLATKKNGYHFNYKKNKWICNRSKQDFWKILEKVFSDELNKKFNFL